MLFNLMDFVVQYRGPNGEWFTGVPLDQQRPTRESDPLIWRRHDWGNGVMVPVDYPPDQVGYQIGDAFLSDDSTYAVTTFSYAPFGTFVVGNGDGGEVYVNDGYTMWIAGTEDGGSGDFVVYFPGRQYGPTGGWLAFRNDAPTGSWAEVVAELQDSPDPNTTLLPNPALTRYRIEMVTLPWKTSDGWSGDGTFRAIISQHFNGSTLDNATEMEETMWMERVGRVWWAYYLPNSPDRTQILKYRLPSGIPQFCGPDLSGWGLQEARLYTNLRQHDGTVTGKNYAWPPPKTINQLLGRA